MLAELLPRTLGRGLGRFVRRDKILSNANIVVWMNECENKEKEKKIPLENLSIN